MKSRSNAMGLMETTLILPAHWASALINGDYSSFTDSAADTNEIEIIRLTKILFGDCVACNDEPSFYTHHDASPDGVLACDCLVYTFIGE